MTTMTETHRQITGGVDTHRDVNVVAALDERGTELGVESFPTTASAYRCALRWLRGFGDVIRSGWKEPDPMGPGSPAISRPRAST